MSQIEVVKIEVGSKYILFAHGVRAEDARRFSEYIDQWLETEQQIMVIALAPGVEVQLEKVLACCQDDECDKACGQSKLTPPPRPGPIEDVYTVQKERT